jgi:hypothetical protein
MATSYLSREATTARIRASAVSPDEGMICLILHYESVDHREDQVLINGDVKRVEMLTKAIPGSITRGGGKVGKAFVIDILERYVVHLKGEEDA